MSSISAWWDVLTTMQKIYWALAIPFSVLLVIQLIITFIGVDADTDVEADADSLDEGGEFHIFTVKNFIVFFTIFGWTGLGCLEAGLSNVASIIIAVVAGFLSMVIMASIFYFMSKLVDSGTLKVQNAVGKTGETYLRIPGNKAGTGKVHIMLQGSNRELDAMTADITDIPSGTIVKVTGLVNEQVLLVSKD